MKSGFTAKSKRILRLNVNGGVWIKPGAAIAYTGAFRFERQATTDARSAQDALFRELLPLVRAVGQGRLFCADYGSHVRIVQIDKEPLVVAGPHVLAFEEAVAFDRSLLG
ncbi:MAG TPA: AIM24 family protein, partial [Candidatus Polarisedimenticolaceae bacterium]|nr:AIM24 family protein [Candidatus Polarisedimenticolaceae bacterium]